MNDTVHQQLRLFVTTYGVDVCMDAQRVEAFLRDVAGEHRREIAVLVGAVREGVPQTLLATSGNQLPTVLAVRLAKELEDNLGLVADAASWAVSAWASALNISGGLDGAPAAYPATAVPPAKRPPSASAGPSRAADGRAARALRLIAEDSDGEYDLQDRLDASQRLARIDPRSAADIFHRIATDDDYDFDERLNAAEFLADLDGSKAAQVLYGLAADEDAEFDVRMAAAERLQALNRDRAADAFFQLAASDDYDGYLDERLDAVTRLAALDPRRAANILYDVATDDQYEVADRLDAAERLADLDPGRVVDVDDIY